MSRRDPQLKVRLPDDLLDRVKAAATLSRRSMNAEIVQTLECAYPGPVLVLTAAPDMLAALENLENDDGKAMPESAWRMVQDAIAKARGRACP